MVLVVVVHLPAALEDRLLAAERHEAKPAGGPRFEGIERPGQIDALMVAGRRILDKGVEHRPGVEQLGIAVAELVSDAFGVFAVKVREGLSKSKKVFFEDAGGKVILAAFRSKIDLVLGR